jgi:hypothetical protein
MPFSHSSSGSGFGSGHSSGGSHFNTPLEAVVNSYHFNTYGNTNNQRSGNEPRIMYHTPKLADIRSNLKRGLAPRPSSLNNSTRLEYKTHGFRHVRHSMLRSYFYEGGSYYAIDPWLSYYIYLYGGVLLFSYYSGIPVWDIAYQFGVDPCKLLTDSGEIVDIAQCDPNMFYYPLQNVYYGPDGLLNVDLYSPAI